VQNRKDHINQIKTELLEMVVDNENKEWLIALLNDIPVGRKIYILQAHFPITILQGEELLNAIINRNNNYLNHYTRILAIRELENLENYKIGGTLVCQLFNPDPLIAEESVLMILKHDPDVLADIIPRLPDDRQEYFSKILEGTTGKRFGQEFYIFKYLRKCTIEGEINDFSLFSLARHFHSLKIEKDKSVDLCELFDDSGFVLCGTAEFIAKTGIQHINIFDKDIISTAKVREDNTGNRSLKITARGDMTLNVLNYSELRELIFDNENDFFSVLPALFYRTNYLSSSM
jgi:hypothetical protein